jgi:tetratricopeptide (TPR) repeat protein
MHHKNARRSTWDKHTKGERRTKKDQGAKKGRASHASRQQETGTASSRRREVVNKTKFSAKINQLFDEENWSRARVLILKELGNQPSDHWLLDRLSVTFYEEKNYKKALELIKQAYELAPNCPLALWDYAGTNDALGKSNAAIKLYKKILNMRAEGPEHDECWEGQDWFASLVLDAHFRLGVCYQKLSKFELARSFLTDFVRMLGEMSVPATYTADEANGLLAKLDEQEKGLLQEVRGRA